MIPYEDLVAALANWRTRNGLPTGHADYLGEPPAPMPVSFEAYQERPAEMENEVEDEIVDLSDDSLEDAVLEEADAPGAEEAAYRAEEAGITLEDGASDGLAYAEAAESAYDEERPDTDAPDGASAEPLFAGDAAPMDGALEEVPPDDVSEAAENYGPREPQDEIPPMADAPDASAQPEEGLFGGQESTEIAESMDFAAPDEALAEPPQGDAPPPDATSQMWPTSGMDQPDEAPLAEPPGDDPVPIDPDEEPPQP